MFQGSGRRVFLFTDDGAPLADTPPEPWWVAQVARRVVDEGAVYHTYELEEDLPDPEEDEWRLYGRRVRAADGSQLIAVVMTDMLEADDLYGSLLGWLMLAGVGALGLTGLAGWVLSGRSESERGRGMSGPR